MTELSLQRTYKPAIIGKDVPSFIKNYWPLIPFVVMVLLFELIPLGGILIRSVMNPVDGSFTISHYIDIIKKPIYQVAIKNSLFISFITAITGLVIVFITGLALSQNNKKTQNVFLSFMNMTSNFAGLPLAFAFMTVLGYSGVFVLIGNKLNIGSLADFNLYSSTGLLLVYIYFQIPLGTLLIIPAFKGIRQEWKEAAALMDASPLQFWLKIGIPVLMPSITGSFAILFANALTAFATPYLLIGNSLPLLPIKISDMFVGDLQQRPELGSALSVTMLLIMIAVISLSNLVKNAFTKGDQ